MCVPQSIHPIATPKTNRRCSEETQIQNLYITLLSSLMSQCQKARYKNHGHIFVMSAIPAALGCITGRLGKKTVCSVDWISVNPCIAIV